MREIDELFEALSRSEFRSRFSLQTKDREYFQRTGLDVILEHADKFVRERSASAHPKNDGKQTPMRGHPVFVAQHATATCCRSCLSKWHRIAQGQELTEEQIEYILSVLRRWLED